MSALNNAHYGFRLNYKWLASLIVPYLNLKGVILNNPCCILVRLIKTWLIYELAHVFIAEGLCQALTHDRFISGSKIFLETSSISLELISQKNGSSYAPGSILIERSVMKEVTEEWVRITHHFRRMWSKMLDVLCNSPLADILRTLCWGFSFLIWDYLFFLQNLTYFDIPNSGNHGNWK